MEKLNEILGNLSRDITVLGTEYITDKITELEYRVKEERLQTEAKTAINQWHIERVKELVDKKKIEKILWDYDYEWAGYKKKDVSEAYKNQFKRYAKAIRASILKRLGVEDE